MKKVFVGLSGGVDSAVSAYLLKEAGYDVTGVFLKVWEPDFLPCTSGQDKLDAMRVSAHLGIPFLSYNLEEEYKKSVVDYFVGEYRAGRTPNPDVMCNRTIKFGAFWEQAQKDGADMIATGHYCRREETKNKKNEIAWKMLRGIDESKDQSYFLWTLTQDDLSHTFFPVGDLSKSEVRAIAQKANLPNAAKRDSQGLCFLGHVDMQEFLKHYITVEQGVVRDHEGYEIGNHDGVAFYTIGERFPLKNGEKMYVVGKDVSKNEIIVSNTPTSLSKNTYELNTIHWIREAYEPATLREAQIRYHGEKHHATLVGSSLTFSDPVHIAAGQSVVLYNGTTSECLGGGIAV